MFLAQKITLADLFMLFIYAEIIGMVGAFYSTNRIPVTLPIIIAITAFSIMFGTCIAVFDGYARSANECIRLVKSNSSNKTFYLQNLLLTK